MITYYTDGSCSPNPGPGGFAVIKETEMAILGSEEMSTNIRMEGEAIKEALKDSEGEECVIFTDSEFWVNILTKWADGWSANGWRKKGGEIRNLDLVKEVHSLYKQSQAQVVWVRGHAGNGDNDLADKWANRAREEKLFGKVLL
ncbi:ribonuclease HI [Candidatus Saccharibacteria bacterium]|nr:ribonuclease HI [Candidatus Saccharibacteria bacterium]